MSATAAADERDCRRTPLEIADKNSADQGLTNAWKLPEARS